MKRSVFQISPLWRVRPGIALVALLVATFTLAACTTAGPDRSTAKPAAAGRDRGPAAPDFTITVYQGEGFQEGQEIKLSDLLSTGKPVVLNLWAGLCPPCRLEMPDLQKVSDEFSDEILLFGVDVGPFTGLGSRDNGRALIRELGVTYPAGTTFDASVVRAYRVRGMPTTFFITPDGEIVNIWTGLLTRDKLAELVGELLAASKG